MKFNANALKKDINLYMRTFGEAYIKDAVKQIENEAKNCVMYFYSTYSPKIYDRTYQFLDNSVTSKVWKSKGSFSGYIDLMSDITGGNIKSNGVIFSNNYNTSGNTAVAGLVFNKGGDYFGIGPSSGSVSNVGFGTTTGINGI